MSHRSVRLMLVATAALLFAPSVASADWTVTPAADDPAVELTNLSAVDCSSANSCIAVGHSDDLQGPVEFEPIITATVAEHWDGSRWQIVPTPNPTGATDSTLSGVSCPRRNVCFAVGSWRTDPSSTPTPLIERWDGTSWSIQPSPGVGNAFLSAVSCSGPRACTAVGNESGGTLAERWDGTGWQVQPTPDVQGPEPSPLGAVSCPRKRTCTATVASNGADSLPLVERWSARSNAWTLQAAQKPAGAEGATFTGVSCPDGRVCFAVGESFGPEDPVFPRAIPSLAERWDGSRWSIMPTPNPTPPPGLRPLATLLGVSCSGRRACHAIGNSFDSTGPITIGERLDGASWQLESIPNLTFHSPGLGGVSCPSRRSCMAVGGWFQLLVHGYIGGTVAARWTP
jgi:hypothetical protein